MCVCYFCGSVKSCEPSPFMALDQYCCFRGFARGRQFRSKPPPAIALSILFVCLFFLLVRVAPNSRCSPLSSVCLFVLSACAYPRSYGHFIFPRSVYVASRYFQYTPPFPLRLHRLALFSTKPALPPVFVSPCDVPNHVPPTCPPHDSGGAKGDLAKQSLNGTTTHAECHTEDHQAHSSLYCLGISQVGAMAHQLTAQMLKETMEHLRSLFMKPRAPGRMRLSVLVNIRGQGAPSRSPVQ